MKKFLTFVVITLWLTNAFANSHPEITFKVGSLYIDSSNNSRKVLKAGANMSVGSLYFNDSSTEDLFKLEFNNNRPVIIDVESNTIRHLKYIEDGNNSKCATNTVQNHITDEDISGTTYNISLNYSEQWFESEAGTAGTKTLIIPSKSNASDVGYITLYLDETYQYEEYFDISSDNIVAFPTNKPWLSSEGSLLSTWKVEFESVPNSTNWYFVKATEYVIIATDPGDEADIYLQFETGSFPSYSGTSFNVYNTTTESDIAMTCQRLNKGNSADDKKVGTAALRMAPAKDGLDGYFYNTTAFASPVTALSFQYAKYGTDTCESFKVYTSTDGSTWTELVDLTSTITESLQTYSNDSTIPADTYFIKFENTSSVSSSTNSRKLDIDEIKIWLTPSNGE